jgi:hypothetical protein
VARTTLAGLVVVVIPQDRIVHNKAAKATGMNLINKDGKLGF